MAKNKTLDTIGRAELIDFPKHGIIDIPARVDTGAKTSAVWASNITLKNDELSFVLFAPGSQYYSGEIIRTKDFSETVVASSVGSPQIRFKVRLTIRLRGRLIKARFTLADRSKQTYPVLLGRSALRGKFIVDVKTGTVLRDKEKARSLELEKILEEGRKK